MLQKELQNFKYLLLPRKKEHVNICLSEVIIREIDHYSIKKVNFYLNELLLNYVMINMIFHLYLYFGKSAIIYLLLIYYYSFNNSFNISYNFFVDIKNITSISPKLMP